ncbi:type II secretion system minor pseudopilin GspI [Steroidobacter sp. S1-65]|uniref:Type II secretion system protein I n=1 Tax=Steroidobacter gossypii TaxID=2805490 RepID=A0ABS1WX62_9GAMM|nr:type II secretion system minor pseudopilin GspI [Steroidobacter gossypii]MBM0105570.1 type II secretion system minor pseudopilin GspI [Steroidobacter gossypii]
MRVHSNRKKGFTLIEVLVALVVVGLGMLAVIQTVSQTANNSSYMREKTIAHWIAMNQLTQVRLQPSAPPIDKSSDEVEMAGRDWRWTMVVTQTPVESIRRIEVRVRPSEAPENSSLAFVSGFYGTAVAPAGTVSLNWSAAQDQGPGPGGQDQRGGDRQDSDNNEPQPDLEPGEVVPPEPENPET